MDDAGVDNCGVTIKCQERPRGDAEQLHHRSHVRPPRRWKQLFGHADHHSTGHPAPEFTCPADSPSSAREMLPLDDATASDNCSR